MDLLKDKHALQSLNVSDLNKINNEIYEIAKFIKELN